MTLNIYHAVLLIAVFSLAGHQITAQSASISGTVRRTNGTPLPGVQVALSGAAASTQVADAMGQYVFNGLTEGESFTITPSWPAQNCLDPCHSVYDQYLMVRHILGLSPLPSPYAMLAADINSSQTITTLDVVQLRSLMLGNFDAFPNNTCRRFIPAEYMFPNPANPWTETPPQTVSISNLTGNAQADFIGIQTGDVSDCAETLTANNLTIIADFSGTVCFNEMIAVPIRVQNFNGIAALQFTLRWDPAALSYQSVLNFGLPGLTGINFGQTTANIQNGILTMTWVASDASGISVPDGTLLVNVFFTAVGSLGSSTPLYFGDAPLPPLAVDGMGAPGTIGIQNGLAEITSPDAVVGPTYCHNGLQFISFYTEGDVSPADGGSLIQNLGDNNYWVYGMNSNDSWFFQTSDPDDPNCQRFYSGTVGTCNEALSPDCDEPMRLTDNATDDDQMRVWGNHLVWQGFDGADYEIFYLNLSDPAANPQAITNNAANDFRPSVWGNRIVWEQDSGGDREILSLSLDDLGATPKNLSNDPAGDDVNPIIWGNFAVWNKGNGLYYHDFAKGETQLLVTTGISNSRFSIWQNRVVWEGQGGGSQEIFTTHLNDPGAGIQQLSNNAFEDADPKIHGNYVVWTGQPAGQGQIFAFELGMSAAPELISTTSSFNNAPEAYGQYAVWAANDGNDYEIYRYDLSQLGSAIAEALTNNSTDDFAPAIWGDHTVWTNDGKTWYLPVHQPGGVPQNLSGDSPAFGEPPLIHGHLALWRGFDGNPELYLHDLTLLPPGAPVLDATASVTNACPGEEATLILENIGTGFIALWFDDEQMSNQLYADVANNYQPAIGSSSTYYAAWQHPITGCIGALTPVALQASATDDLACNTALSLSLNDQCEVEILTDFLLEGNFGCLGTSDFTIEVMDGNPGNGHIVDGPGTFVYTVTLASGAAGNFTSCFGTVTAVDFQPISIQCPDDQSIMAGVGQMEAPALWPEPTVISNCPATLNSTFNSGDIFPIGTTPVVYTASVGNGNTATCDFDITVLPTIQADVTLEAGSTSVEVGDQFCIPVTVSGFADLVAFQFSMTYDPALLQVESVSAFGLPDLDASNFNLAIPGVISVQWLDLTGGGISLPDGATIFQICFTAIAPGTSPIDFTNTPATIEFIDANNTEAAVTLNPGTVVINTPLVLVCPNNVVVANAPGRCDNLVSIPIPILPGAGTLTTQFGNIDASGLYPVGETTIVYTFIGSETLTCSFTVTVLDTEPPVLVCPPDDTIVAPPGGCNGIPFNPPIPQFSDNCPPVTLSGVRDDGRALDELFFSGVTCILWLAQDSTGNRDTCTYCITIELAGNPPQITCSPDVMLFTDPGLCENNSFVMPDPLVVNDSCATFLGVSFSTGAYGPYPKGVQTFTFYAQNDFGVDSCDVTVTVLDAEPPTLICPPNVTMNANLADGGAVVVFGDFQASDNCPMTILDCSHQTGDFFPCGETAVACVLTDMAGNTAECSFTVTVECTAPCQDSLSLTPTPADTSDNNCCWTLDYANTGSQEVWAVQLLAQDGVTMHYTLATGYAGIGSETDLSIISTSFGPLPASVDGLIDLCLGHISAVPQTLIVTYLDRESEIICTDELSFSCPPEEACLYILTDSLVCDSLGYKYTAVVKNPIGSDFEVGFVKFNITPSLPGGVTYNPGTEFILSPKLAPGESTTIMFTIETGLNLFGDSLCFILSAHDDERERLCCAEIQACVPFPQCDPCEYADVEVQALETPGDTCCYELLLNNNHPMPGYFTQVQTTVVTPGAYFSSVEFNFASGWWNQNLSTISAQTDDLLWNHISGAVPQMSDFNLFDFCIAGVTTTDSIYIEVAWISGDSVLCVDSVAVWCPACVVVTQDTVLCNPDGTYTYTFSGENWSDYSVNAIGFVEVGTGFSVTPEVIPLSGLIPPYPSPGNAFGPVSVTITPSGAVPGDTICIDLVLRQVLNDSINILCCFVTHCFVLPECEPQGEMPPIITVDAPPTLCINNNLTCTGPVNVSFTAVDACLLTPLVVRAFLDLNGDNILEAGVQLEPDNSLTTLAGLPGAILISGSAPNYFCSAGDVPVGMHLLIVQAVDGCGNISQVMIPIEIIDCLAPSIVCINGLTANISGFIDTDGDAVPDQPGVVLTPDIFLAFPSFDCSVPVTYSINRPGTTPTPTQTSIALTCNDLGTVVLHIHAWDAAGNHDFCEAFVILQDNSGLCPVPPPGDGGIRIFPNPADREIWVEIPPGNWRDLGLIDPGGAVLFSAQPGNRRLLRVDTERLPPGLYIVRLRSMEGELRVARFVRR
ncbi:MAG TPA: HYR domain-containing protein [Saprospiraceae bacterium]|nr:HYR domain-containing protein [Saprospiraceae bacterium]